MAAAVELGRNAAASVLHRKRDSNTPLKRSSGKYAKCLQLIHLAFLLTNVQTHPLVKFWWNSPGATRNFCRPTFIRN
jgi:hypothetical protein